MHSILPGPMSVADLITRRAMLAGSAGGGLALGAPLQLCGNLDLLEIAVANLLENAVKYGGSGGTVTVHIAREQLPRGPGLRVDVMDQGEGIDPVHIPRLTERFYRVDSHRSRAMGGTGLGLAIVKHIVQRHRGRLVIESEIGNGSKFSILLPMA